MAAAGFRIFLMPIDTCKTILQVEGANGLQHLRNKIRAHGPVVLYHSSIAASAATFVGHYPWFMTYNFLNGSLPQYHDHRGKKLVRNAGIGFVCSCVADTVANSLRVVKTYRQTHQEKVSYITSVKHIIHDDGVVGLFGRGLRTRLLANGMQGLLFSVLWKYFDEYYSGRRAQ
uniref:Peroxisomal adenine nucleotide transporter 1 n=1 Tax=Lygus hesperus TaxID=30085 RepID=A0A0A9Z085_LYGHE